MKTLDLIRTLSTPEATHGCIVDPHAGKLICLTLELPDRDNQRNISCIPPGSYIVDPNDKSTRFGEHWAWVKDVNGRSRIGIHAGNFLRETRGCVLVGLSTFEQPDEGPAVGNSRDALHKLLQYVGGELFMLVVGYPRVTTKVLV